MCTLVNAPWGLWDSYRVFKGCERKGKKKQEIWILGMISFNDICLEAMKISVLKKYFFAIANQ